MVLNRKIIQLIIKFKMKLDSTSGKRLVKSIFNNLVNPEIRQIPVQTFVDKGGLGKFWKLFGNDTEKLLEEINEELAA